MSPAWKSAFVCGCILKQNKIPILRIPKGPHLNLFINIYILSPLSKLIWEKAYRSTVVLTCDTCVCQCVYLSVQMLDFI